MLGLVQNTVVDIGDHINSLVVFSKMYLLQIMCDLRASQYMVKPINKNE